MPVDGRNPAGWGKKNLTRSKANVLNYGEGRDAGNRHLSPMTLSFGLGAISASVFALFITSLSAGLSAQTIETAQPNDITTSSIDCTDISVDYEDDPLLTRQENIALMNQAFYKSLSKHDVCQNAQSSVESTSSSTADSGGSGSSLASSNMSGVEGSQSSELIDSVASTASSEMSGTEESASTNDAETISNEFESDAIKSASAIEFGNGKIPDDIPAVDNDSILEAQIRQAAINETDPDIKAKLWNEYRRYKGLPVAN